MGSYTATVRWQRRDEEAFVDQRYSRAHTWHFDGGAEVPASSSPQVVPLPYSDESAVDPEEAFVASLSSCHMLFFLSFAARDGFVVERYEDEAIGSMGRNDEGKQVIAEVRLRPSITFRDASPPAEHVSALHEEAHDACFIANSVHTAITVDPL